MRFETPFVSLLEKQPDEVFQALIVGLPDNQATTQGYPIAVNIKSRNPLLSLHHLYLS
jgi:hypothetical protein